MHTCLDSLKKHRGGAIVRFYDNSSCSCFQEDEPGEDVSLSENEDLARSLILQKYGTDEEGIIILYTNRQMRAHNCEFIFLFLNQNMCCGCSKEPSQRDGSFENLKHMFKLKWIRNKCIFNQQKGSAVAQ